MSKITLQYSIANQTPGNATPVEANFTRIEQHINQEVIERAGSVSMTGQLRLAADPVAALDAAPKQYVDGLVPIGSITMYVGGSAPVGGKWLLCNGAELETASYPDLFAIIGTAYGGSGGRFNVPNMVNRFPLGPGIAPIGSVGGTRDAVVPNHTHTVNHTHATATTGTVSADHTHTYSGVTGTENQAHNHVLRGAAEASSGSGFGEGNVTDITNVGFGPFANTGNEQQAHNHNFSGTTAGISANHTHNVDVPAFNGSSGAASGGVAPTDQNLPPYIVVNFLIKVA